MITAKFNNKEPWKHCKVRRGIVGYITIFHNIIYIWGWIVDVHPVVYIQTWGRRCWSLHVLFPQVFACTRGTYDFMVKDLSRQVKIMLETLSNAIMGAHLNLHAWRCMRSQLMLGNDSAIYLKAYPNLQVIYVEK